MPHSHPHSPRSVCRKLQLANPPSTRAPARLAFTLVELMVVIGIIGLLTAISVPVVMKALASARTAAIKAEIDMLHMAIMNYKAEYGSFPPCVDTFFNSETGYTAAGEAAKHVKRLFPRCINVPAQLNAAWAPGASPGRTEEDTFWLQRLFGDDVPATADLHLIPHNAIYLWLSGYNETDQTSPLIASVRNKLFDFDTSRIRDNRYSPPRKSGSPYIYIDSAFYERLGAEPDTHGFFNEDTFQLLCAGADEVYGTDDDLSNFWPGTRKDYADSMAQ